MTASEDQHQNLPVTPQQTVVPAAAGKQNCEDKVASPAVLHNRATLSDQATNPIEPVAVKTQVLSEKKKKKKRKKQKQNQAEFGTTRGIETLFRNLNRTHLELTNIADNKANIMITVNGFIISIVMASSASLVNLEFWLLIPSFSLLITSLVSIFFAILAARPRLGTNDITFEDMANDNNANVIFFGHFSKLSEEQFVHSMTNMIKRIDRVYLNMIRDNYEQGKILILKFHRVHYAYMAFLGGLTITIFSFIICLTIATTV